MKDLRDRQWGIGSATMRHGVWQAELISDIAGGTPPNLRVLHDLVPVPEVEILSSDGAWLLRVPVPTGALNDGAQVFVVEDADTGRQLTSFTLVLGAEADADLRGEVALLRAELDLLKKALRRRWQEG